MSFSSSAGSSYTIYANPNPLGFLLHQFQRIWLSQQGVRCIQHSEGSRTLFFCVAGHHWFKAPSCVPSRCLGFPIDSGHNWNRKILSSINGFIQPFTPGSGPGPISEHYLQSNLSDINCWSYTILVRLHKFATRDTEHDYQLLENYHCSHPV